MRLYNQKKKAYYFKNTKKFVIMLDEDKEIYGNNSICGFCEKNIESDRVIDLCQLTGKYRGPAHNTWNEKQSNFIPFVFHSFSNYDCHMFFKRLVDLKKW